MDADYRVVLERLLSIDFSRLLSFLKFKVKRKFFEAGVDKVVIGLSGGLDSSVVLKVLSEALGHDRVLALLMPDPRVNTEDDVEHAVKLAESLRVEYRIVKINTIVDEYVKASGLSTYDLIPLGNLRSRIRMAMLYYYANIINGLVVGTSDKSEILIGYFTKYGDGAADLYPIACLYKTQVRRFAEYLGLPKYIVDKPSSPGFWIGHLAEEEIGLKYEVLDSILYLLFDEKLSVDEIVDKYGFDKGLVIKVLEMHKRSGHKRILFDEEDLYIPMRR